MRKLTNI